MRVALVHDWLTGLRGGEKCLQAFLKMYPNADIYTLLHQPNVTDPIIDRQVKGTSFFQKLPQVHRYYRALLPLYPLAARSLKIEGYDLVISLSHAAAKNISTSDSTTHICYCFTPMRYVWDQAPHYFGVSTVGLWPFISALRSWDKHGSQGVDGFVAISSFVAARIRKFYGRKASVIFPPVDTSWIKSEAALKPSENYLCAGALVPYKHPEVAIAACKKLGRKLWVVGKGPMQRALAKLQSEDVKLLGPLSNARLAWCYQNCRALLFPGKEDFGMIPVECMAGGRPVIGQVAGGLSDTVVGIPSWQPSYDSFANESTGVFFKSKSGSLVNGMIEAIECYESIEHKIQSEHCVAQAQKFSPERFYESWGHYISGFGFDRPTVDPSADDGFGDVAA